MAFCATRSGGRLCGGGILVRTEKHSSKARHGTTNCALRLRNKLESKRRVAYSERRGPGAGPMRLPLSPFSPHENRPSRMRKREVLRAGYAMMVALLIISAVEAYRIQQSASLQSADIYRRYVKGEELLYRCRRALFLGSIYARDFLLSPRPDRVFVFRSQLTELRAESQRALDELDQLSAPKPHSLALRGRTQEYWDTLQRLLDWSDEARAKLAFDFVQQEIAPRRNAAGDLVRELGEAGQQALSSSEEEFAKGRRSAAVRLSLILGLCLVLGVAVAYFSLSHSENLERQTARQYQELEQLSGRLLEVQEDERRRIARELHDEIGQTLTALRIEVSHAQGLWKSGAPGVPERLERARSLAEKTLQTVRDISLLLRPPLLDDLGLAEALQWHLEDFTRRTGIICDFADDGLQDSLPDAYKICVYRIVQEALHNCEAHAAASRVRLSVRQLPQQLTVEIQDDGRGFGRTGGVDSRSNGLGIIGMRERAAMLGGTLQVDAAPGGGARVRLSLPVPRRTPATAQGTEKVRA